MLKQIVLYILITSPLLWLGNLLLKKIQRKRRLKSILLLTGIILLFVSNTIGFFIPKEYVPPVFEIIFKIFAVISVFLYSIVGSLAIGLSKAVSSGAPSSGKVIKDIADNITNEIEENGVKKETESN